MWQKIYSKFCFEATSPHSHQIDPFMRDVTNDIVDTFNLHPTWHNPSCYWWNGADEEKPSKIYPAYIYQLPGLGFDLVYPTHKYFTLVKTLLLVTR